MSSPLGIRFTKIESVLLFVTSLTVIAFIRLELTPMLADKLPLLFFIVNSLTMTYFLGPIAGLGSFVLGTVFSWLFIVPDSTNLQSLDIYSFIYFCSKFVTGILLILLFAYFKDEPAEFYNHH